MEPAASYTPPVLGLAFASLFLFFFFNDTATTEIYTLSLHDALPILGLGPAVRGRRHGGENGQRRCKSCHIRHPGGARSEEHTSELQSQSNLVCRLLLEKKKKKQHQQKNYPRGSGAPNVPLTWYRAHY